MLSRAILADNENVGGQTMVGEFDYNWWGERPRELK
jgi:hypothetical protein